MGIGLVQNQVLPVLGASVDRGREALVEHGWWSGDGPTVRRYETFWEFPANLLEGGERGVRVWLEIGLGLV